MLRESGQAALDRGDKPAAEAAWRAMLKMVLVPPTTSKPSKPAPPPSPAPPPGAPPTPVVRPTPPGGLALPAGTSVITLERFEQVAQLAKLAVDHDLNQVSIDAMRGAAAATGADALGRG